MKAMKVFDGTRVRKAEKAIEELEKREGCRDTYEQQEDPDNPDCGAEIH